MEAERFFPTSATLLRHLTNRDDRRRPADENFSSPKLLGHINSTHRRFVTHVVQKMQGESTFLAGTDLALRGRYDHLADNLGGLPHLEIVPWLFPDENLLKVLEAVCSPDSPMWWR